MPERGLGGEFERHNVLALGVVLVSDARPLEPSRARELFDGASSPRPPRAPSLIVIGRSTQRVSDTDRVYGNGHSVLYSTGAASFQPEQGEYRGSHGLVLQSLDTNASAINGRYAVSGGLASAPRRDESPEPSVVCPWFGHDDLEMGHSSSWVETTNIPLTRQTVHNSMGEVERVYSGEFVIHPVTKLNRFPFDTIQIEMTYETEGVLAPCASREGAVLSFPSFLNVKSTVPGFVIASEGFELARVGSSTKVRLYLARNRFLRSTAVLLWALGFLSTLLFVRTQWTGAREQWSTLAYFAGLWAARDILLSVISEPKPFPPW